MNRSPVREGALDAQPWAATLLPRFAWLAERLPWFAAPVALHAWPWIGRLVVWGGAALTVALLGHAWNGGRAWHRASPGAAADTTEWQRALRHAGTSSPSLFPDEALTDAPVQTLDTPLPQLADGISDAALQILTFARTARDSDAGQTDDGEIAVVGASGAEAADAFAGPGASFRWAAFSDADVLEAIAAGSRAEAALSGLRQRARALDLMTVAPAGHNRSQAAVTQWAQWMSAVAKRHDVAVDRFVVEDRSEASDASAGDDASFSASSDRASTRRSGAPGGQGDFEHESQTLPEALATQASVDSLLSPHPLSQRATRIAVRGSFESLAAFIAALSAATPPVVVHAAQIMPDQGSKGARLALHAALLFIDADKPRVSTGGVGTGHARRSLASSSLDAVSERPLAAHHAAASDAKAPANPFQRRGQAQTDIVVLATYASGGRRAVLLARHAGGFASSRSRRASKSAAFTGAGSDREAVALARPGETFADVRVIAVEADRVRLRPLLGGDDLVVRLARDETSVAP